MKKILYTFLAVSIIFLSCQKKVEELNNTNNNTELAIGDTHEGGIIFYLDGNGGGLIAAPSDHESKLGWTHYLGDISGADGTAIGTGYQNTIDIESADTISGTAADICANLTLGGYSDWFLPSLDELNEMCLNIGPLAFPLGNIGGFISPGYYWSSTEYDYDRAWEVDVYGCQQYYFSKGATFYVRPIRSF